MEKTNKESRKKFTIKVRKCRKKLCWKIGLK